MQTEKPLFNLSAQEALQALNSSKDGLSEHEASKRLKQYGPNILKPKKQSFLKRLIEPFASLFVSILVVAMIISLFSHESVDAIVIAFVLVLNAAIYYVQQFSAGRVLKALRQEDIGKVHLKRGGQTLQLEVSQIVPGDVIYLEEGLKVPADGRIIECDNLHIDEAILTGESLPVSKTVDALEGTPEVYDQKNTVFMGTLIHAGRGIMLAGGTGNHTEIGKISQLVSGAELGRSPIEKKIDAFIRKMALYIGVLGLLVFLLALARGISTAEALRFTLALVVSVVPEGLPVALTVVLLLSAKKLAKVKALIKKISSIETLGAITVIATDKTGTLTKNKLSVAETAITGDKETFAHAVMASLNGDEDLHTDPLDNILDQHFNQHVPHGWKKLKEYPFQQALRVSGVLWDTGKGKVLFVKGAPESVFEYGGMSGKGLEKQLEEFTGKGYRTIGVGHIGINSVPKELEPGFLKGLQVDGLLGLADELRDGIVDSIAEARAAGVKVVMLTGDHVATAKNIAMNIGLATSAEQVKDGASLETDNPESLNISLVQTTAFGRVLPRHKFNFLKAVKNKEITAMTGDGVNDIPALVEADAGLAMGSGTDAAKAASEIVLLDDNFKTIIAAIKVGRSVVSNIRKMLFYVISTSIGEAMTMVGALLIGLALPVTAVQVLWINLVTDGFTVLPLGISPPEKHQMEQGPNNPKAPFLSRWYINRMVVTGLVMAIVTLILFNAAEPKGYAYAQTVAFLALVVAQLANALNANFDKQSWVRNLVKPNKPLWIGIILAGLFQLAAMYGPLSDAFKTVPLSAKDFLVASIVPLVAVLIVGDLHKLAMNLLAKGKTSKAD